MVLSQFHQKVNFAQCSIYNFSLVFWGGDETFPKFAESFAKILAKFHELKISKKTHYLYIYIYRSSSLSTCIHEGFVCTWLLTYVALNCTKWYIVSYWLIPWCRSMSRKQAKHVGKLFIVSDRFLIKFRHCFCPCSSELALAPQIQKLQTSVVVITLQNKNMSNVELLSVDTSNV